MMPTHILWHNRYYYYSKIYYYTTNKAKQDNKIYFCDGKAFWQSFQDSLMDRKLHEQHLFIIEIFWNIINICTAILIHLMCPC